MVEEINIPREQQEALAAIDTSELTRIIEQAIRTERLDSSHRSLIVNCGTYVATQLHYFEQALSDYASAKAQRKHEKTKYALDRAARDLVHAIEAMKRRVSTELEESQRFLINDQVIPPFTFDRNLSVTVSYQWRRTVEDVWKYGSITFAYEVDLRPDYAAPVPKRKPSVAKQEQELQERLYRTWENLTRGALYSVRDYFRNGGEGSKIPVQFEVRGDEYSRGLNNYSTDFWRT